MNLSSSAESIRSYIYEQMAQSKTFSKITPNEDFRDECSFSVMANVVSYAVGQSDGLFEISLHERSEDDSINLMYATILLDQPEGGATLTITSDTDESANYEAILLNESISLSGESYAEHIRSVFNKVDNIMSIVMSESAV